MATVSAAITDSNTITATLNSVATNTFVTSSAIDNSANLYVNARIQLKWKTGAAGTSATGYVNVYLIASADGGTTYDDNNKLLIGQLPVIANATTYIGSFSTAPFGDLPSHFKIGVENQGGGTSDTTAGNFLLQYAGHKYTVA
jgi:hypothetical protein